ncbi:MAG: FAD-binding protein [Saprospiraceae bacterium]|nr:FAD-binding protein [Saprospiraceae bacterium]
MDRIIVQIDNFEGEILSDDLSRALYATDASLYQKLPDLVVVPASFEDVRKALDAARKNKLNVLPRGSATSLAGQTVNRGMVIDFTKNFNKILQVDAEHAYAVVQPGVTRDQLNREVACLGLHFAPDPATSSRATFGGMIANNSSGTKSVLYGKTSDHVISLKVMLSTGEILDLEDLSPEAYEEKCKLKTREGNLYAGIRDLVFDNADEIRQRFPKVMRRVGGYALDAFVDSNQWNLSSLVIGSEGTLAVILEAKVKLTPLPKFQNMVIVHYDDRLQSIASVKDMIVFGPAAIEMLDFNVLHNSKFNAITRRYYESIITGEPQAVMTVEFYGDSEAEVDAKAEALCTQLKNVPSAYAYPVYKDKQKINDALALRKDGLGLIMSKPGIRKPIPFVEDAAIPLEHLANYIKELEQLCTDHGSEVVLYAHASVGVLHVRPTIDLTDQADIDKMKMISDRCFELVMKYSGSWSGEHGDGRARSPKMREFYGDTIYEAFKKIKVLFDPDLMFNPNIILEAEDMRHHLRYYDHYKDKTYPFVYKYRAGAGFADIVHNCSGVGACRNTEGGTMCPSFRATGNEIDSTRGRANVLRLAMSSQLHFKDLADKDVKEVLDLCLSCKACKTECPSNVDMAKLKSEVLQIHYDAHGQPLSSWVPRYASLFSRLFSGAPSGVVNLLLASRPVRKINQFIFGISAERKLPEYASQTLVSWYAGQKIAEKERKVVLYADTYINYHETQMGKDAINLLQKCGYEVILADVGCCQRPLISNGFLKVAKEKLEMVAVKLAQFVEKGYPILTVEPSCHSALTDDLPDLIENEVLGNAIRQHTFPIEVFLVNEWKEGKLTGRFTSKQINYLLHGHCHQKSGPGTAAAKILLGLAGCNGTEADTGCCGMAGSFGYETKHLQLSKKIADMKLLPAMEKMPHAAVVANGFSCRHQVSDFSDREAFHVISMLDYEAG